MSDRKFLATNAEEQWDERWSRWVRVVADDGGEQEWFVAFSQLRTNPALPAATVVWGEVASKDEREAIIAAARKPVEVAS